MAHPPSHDAALRQALATHLVAEPAVSEIAHPVLAALVLVLLWHQAPTGELLGWVAAICATTGLRVLVRRRLAARRVRAPLEGVPAGLRVAIVLVALSWGAGIAWLAPHIPATHLALVMVVLCGLSAAATSSLVGDPPTYYAYTAVLLGPLAVGVVAAGHGETNLVALVMVVAFGAGMSGVYRRAHRTLAEYLLAAGRLERSEARLFQTLESLPVGIMVVDPRGQPYFANAMAKEILGRGVAPGTTSERLAEVYGAFVAGSDRPYPAERMPIVRALAGEPSSVDDMEIHRPDGVVSLEVSGSPLHDPDGVVFGVAAFSDITERRRTALRIATEHGVFRVLAETSSADAVIPEVLRVICESVGCDLGSVFGADAARDRLRCLGFWHRPGIDVAELEALTREPTFARGAGLLGRVWEGARPIWIEDLTDEGEFPRARAAMAAGIRSVIGIPLWDAGTIIGVMEMMSTHRIAQDAALAETLGSVGARVGNALARRRAEAALREAEAEYRQLVEAASEMVWRADMAGRLTFVNAAGAGVYGRPARDLLGRAFADLADEAHRERDREMFARVLGGGDVADHETVHLAADGTRRHLSTSAHPIRDVAGAIVGVHGIVRDVSARAAVRDALQAARDAAEQAAAARSAFLANMSHEIRTPLNGILGMAELLLDGDLAADDRRSVELILDSGEALLGVINDVLDFSKIEAGQVDIEAIEYDLPSLVEATARVLAPRLREKAIDLVVDLDDHLPPLVLGDPTRVRQVLTNLLGNAVKFTDQGEVVVAVRAEPLAPGRVELRFEVRDTGIGIAADKLSSIFEPFRQADASTTRRFGGTGLGLSICRRLVDLMGGRLSVDSVAGRGSTFGFTVPCAVAARQPTVRTPAVDLRGIRVLLVDDNATNRRVTRAVLERAGCAVDETTGAVEALERMREAAAAGRPYRMLVSDVLMPEHDGFDLARRVRDDAVLARTPIVLETSAGQRGDPQRCRDLGIDAFLLKPVPRQELIDAVSMALGAGVAPPAGTRPDQAPRAGTPEAPRRLRVLLAEDNPVNQEVAASMLRRRGHRVDVVASGTEAVDAALVGEYDVVLMDLQMPGLDGIGATRRIRERRAGRPLPIVALTANALAGERERCLAAGMDDYLAKPFRAEALFAVVEGRSAGDAAVVVAEDATTTVGHVDVASFRSDLAAAGVEQALPELLALFVADAPARMTALRDAVRAGDLAAVDRAAHAFRSAAATIHADGLAEMLRRAERAARTAEPAELAALSTTIDGEFALVMRELDVSGR